MAPQEWAWTEEISEPWRWISITLTQEESSMGYEDKQPLHIPREALIAAVQTRFDEEKQKRADAEAARSEARKAAVEAVSKFSPDQLTNIVSEYLRHVGASNGNEALVKWAEEKQEAKAFTTKELQVTTTESSLEKWLRVLNLASDKEIEVSPTDEVYLLL